MNILQQLESKNKAYKLFKAELDKRIKGLEDTIAAFNNSIDLEEIYNNFTYQEIKHTYNNLKDNTTYDFNKKFYDLLQRKKKATYPELSIAPNYPIINEMDFLTEDQKSGLDNLLAHSFDKGSYIMTGSSAWNKVFKYNYELTNKVLEFLHSKGILERTYRLSCGCGSSECSSKYITQEQYDKFIAYHSITQEQFDNMTDEEYEIRMDKWEEEGYFYTGCWNGSDVEVCSIEDLKKKVKIGDYKNIADRDLTYENL
jgi:hypothetical protein